MPRSGFNSENERFTAVVIHSIDQVEYLVREQEKKSKRGYLAFAGLEFYAEEWGKIFGTFMAGIRYGIFDQHYEIAIDQNFVDVCAYIISQFNWMKKKVAPAFVKKRIRTNIRRRISVGKDTPQKKQFLTQLQAVFV